MENNDRYYCLHCGEFVPYAEIVDSECPWCRAKQYKHKKCGAKVEKK